MQARRLVEIEIKLDFHQCFVLCRSEIRLLPHRLRPGMDRLHTIGARQESRRLRKFRHHILLDSRWHCVFCWGERISFAITLQL